ncbi:MAG: cell surface protein SprA [bacterium]
MKYSSDGRVRLSHLTVLLIVTTLLFGFTHNFYFESKSTNNYISTVKDGVPAAPINLSERYNKLQRLKGLENQSALYADSGLVMPGSPDSNAVIVSDSLLTIKDSILTKADSLLSKADSLLAADSIKVDSMAIDSTARLRYFRAQRVDQPVISFREKKKSGFFTYPTPNKVKRTVTIDSSGQFVLISETVGNQEAKHPLKIPIDQYIDMSIKALRRDIWEEIGYKYELKSSEIELSKFLSDITNIQIPLPRTGFFTIFGKPEISIKINGAVDIHGAWRNETTEGLTASALGNTRNEPDFKQQVQINVSGTIGDKLNISADWNTERTFEYENQLKLKYTGYDDEIVQSIEAGNVSLQTSPLVGGSEALFGIKSLFKIGPLTLTALASQKKSEVQEVSVSGGAEKNEFEIHAYEYSTNHYFLDEIYADTSAGRNFFFEYYGKPVFSSTGESNYYRVKDIEVWKTVIGIGAQNERTGNAYIDLESRGKDELYNNLRDTQAENVPGQKVIGLKFERLTEGVDYEIHTETGYISFLSAVNEKDNIAVAYRIEGPSGTEDEYYGEFLQDLESESASNDSIIVLKLIKPADLKPQYKKAWQLQLKNIYPIGGRDVKEEGFKLDIKYQVEVGDPVNVIGDVSLINAFGLDLTDDSKIGNPDGAFDFSAKTIIPKTGEIIFPRLKPFGWQFPENLADTMRYDAVYDTTVTFAKQDRAKDKFIITGEYSAAVSSTFDIGFNVVENSVRVLLGGQALSEGSDYKVDYNIGQITILKDAALVPGADLKITYEQNDLFQLASKTLVGLRGIYDYNKDTQLGFSFLNLNQQTLSDKVRIGEEPLNNSIFGVDFKTKFDLPFITDGLNHIISTKQMSSMTLRGEYAYMSPDPNTKKSTISSDDGKSIAYIDDFEGSKRVIPVGIAYTSWDDLSVPEAITDFPNDIESMEKMNYKGKSFWFSVLPSDVLVEHIWPERQAAREDQQVTVLDYVFRPDAKGIHNYNPNWNPDTDNLKEHWGGMMKVLSSSASDLVEENIEFIEFYMKLVTAPTDAELNIDLGQISEDIIPNGKLNTEDLNQNLLVDEGEDVGIDGINDADEKALYGDIADPSGDNFVFASVSGGQVNYENYKNINGTEGNAQLSDAGRLPDTEDLNGNFSHDRVNSYFRYTIPIDTISTNPFIKGGGNNDGWYLFRIPLKDFTYSMGDPSFSQVEYIRVWMAGVEQEVHMRIAEFNLVGSQWQKVLVPGLVTQEDSVLSVSTVSVEDNPFYASPPGVARERDRSKPDQEVYKNEQALQLIIKELVNGQNREVIKYLYKPLDIFSYKEMKLFMHGDNNPLPGNLSYYSDSTNYGAEAYFRFGTDSLNFYEYRQPIRPDWTEISIKFDELTALKQARDSLTNYYTLPVSGSPGNYYGVKGDPTLTKVTFFTFGIINPKDKGEGETVSGELWINELRVLNADDTPGWAYTAAATLKFADLLTVNVNMSKTDPYFHQLANRFGNRIDNSNWGVSFDFDVLKLIPISLNESNFTINYQRTESVAKPIYLPGTDIKVDEAVEKQKAKLIANGVSESEATSLSEQTRTNSQSINVSDTWSISNFRIKIPTSAWYVRDLFNKLSFNFNYNKTNARNPTTVSSKNWQWNFSTSYSLNLSKDNYFKPANIPIIGDVLKIFSDYKDLKVYYTPSSISSGFSANRRRSFTLNRLDNAKPIIQRDFTASRNAALSWKVTDGGLLNLTLDYRVDVQSSLAHLLTETIDENTEIDRPESEIWSDVFKTGLFGRDNSYRQSFDIKTSPKLPSLFNISRYFTLTAGYSASYSWQNNFQQGDLGRSAGFTTRINTGMTLRLKSLFDPLFEETQSTNATQQQTAPDPNKNKRGKTRDKVTPPKNQGNQPVKEQGNPPTTDKNDVAQQNNTASENISDTTATTDTTITTVDSTEVIPGTPIYTKALNFLRDLSRYLLLNYQTISVNFNQDNSQSGSGLLGTGSGFGNFWGLKNSSIKGPSRLFMLGLSYDIGPRAPNGNLNDNFSQKNSLDFKTSRPLWEGANIDLNWKVGWGINKSVSITTEPDGSIMVTNLTATGNIDRSFVSFPPSLIFSMFNSGVKRVSELYDPDAADPNANLSSAFIDGFESLPLLSKIPFLATFAKYIPRPNWRISWSGLEKLSFFDGIAQRVTIDHAYTSSYNEGWKIDPDGTTQINTQRISYGFAPLVGLDVVFPKIWEGNLSASVKYSTKSAFDLRTTTKTIEENFTRDISVTASFSRKGFEIPLFGLALTNDVEFSISYTNSKNSVVNFEMDDFKEEGVPQDGTNRTTIEPRMKFVMSSKVSLSIFYRRTTVEPEGASRIPATTTNEAGLDVNISIN